MSPTNKNLSSFLRKKHPKTGFLDKLKVVYRPYICPFSLLLLEVNNRDSVFDIGCGSGQFLLLISEFSGVKKIGGIEIKQELIDNAKSLLEGIHVDYLSIYDGKELPQEVALFDSIILNDVWHHIPKTNQDTFLREIYLKMKKGSILVFKDIDASSFWVYFNRFHDLLLGEGGGHELSHEEMKRKSEEMGFHVKKSFKKRQLWYDHYFLILEK
jgi:2-polyprenyl-3-methyl-5-hydroxy-6-metoxy-1,4-benzoquinol methylase